MNTRLLTLPLAVLALAGSAGALVAPAGTPQQPQGTELNDVPFLSGRWNVVRLEGGELMPRLTRATLSFENGRVAGSTGCNTVTGAFSVAGFILSVGQLASTRKLCAPAAMRAERAVQQALQGAKNYQVRGNTLRITGDGGTLQLARAK